MLKASRSNKSTRGSWETVFIFSVLNWVIKISRVSAPALHMCKLPFGLAAKPETKSLTVASEAQTQTMFHIYFWQLGGQDWQVFKILQQFATYEVCRLWWVTASMWCWGFMVYVLCSLYGAGVASQVGASALGFPARSSFWRLYFTGIVWIPSFNWILLWTLIVKGNTSLGAIYTTVGYCIVPLTICKPCCSTLRLSGVSYRESLNAN